MYFDFSKEQYLARDSAREFLTSRLPTRRLRELITTEAGFDPDVWRGLAELGWFSVMVPEEHGGLGLGFLDLALLLEESGRALVPAPLVETAVMLPLALAAGTREQRQRWLPRIATGDAVATFAFSGREGLPPPTGLGARAHVSGGDWVLDGDVLLVPFGQTADVVLTAARTVRNDGACLFVLEAGDRGITWEPLPSLDPTLRLHALHLERVRVGSERLIGEAGTPTLSRVLQAGSAAFALQAVGGAAAALSMAVEYAKVRRQFDRPIGGFQAIKHICADMAVALETTRSGAYHAAWSIDADVSDAAVPAATAKATCTEMFGSVAAAAIQVHGGIVFTWEHDLHFYFKRAKYLEFAHGAPAQHREAVAAARFPARRSG